MGGTQWPSLAPCRKPRGPGSQVLQVFCPAVRLSQQSGPWHTTEFPPHSGSRRRPLNRSSEHSPLDARSCFLHRGPPLLSANPEAAAVRLPQVLPVPFITGGRGPGEGEGGGCRLTVPEPFRERDSRPGHHTRTQPSWATPCDGQGVPHRNAVQEHGQPGVGSSPGFQMPSSPQGGPVPSWPCAVPQSATSCLKCKMYPG